MNLYYPNNLYKVIMINNHKTQLIFNSTTHNKRGEKNITQTNEFKIKVPSKLVINKEFKSELLYLYITLKQICNYKTHIVKVNAKTLLDKLNWSDNRTLKKYLQKLKDEKYIEYDFKLIAKYKPIEIKIIDIKTNFIWITQNTIEKTILATQQIKIKKTINEKDIVKYRDIRERAIRLIYLFKYYSTMENSKTHKYICPSYDEIKDKTGIDKNYIGILTKSLKKAKLIGIIAAKNYTGYYDDDGNHILERNKYQLYYD